jgi:hypothetical protein
MSREKLIEAAAAHPEIIAIGIEVTLDPSRRRHYSTLVLTLADAAMKEMVRMIATETPLPSGVGHVARDDLFTGG